MRKILLGTTAVAGAALFAVSTAQAQQAPTVTIGGYFAGFATMINDDADKARPIGTSTSTRSGTRQSTDFRSDLEIVVNVNAKAANGLSYGAVIEIQNDNVNGNTLDLDEAYVFVSSPTLGTIRFGDEDSAASLLQVRVPTIAGMSPDVDWADGLAARQTGTDNRIDRYGPSLMSSINGGSDATKIVYLSPSFAGFDFGVSFAPNGGEGERGWSGFQADREAFNNVSHRDRAGPTNEWSAAIRYRGTLGPVGVAAGAAMMRAEANQGSTGAGNQDITANSLGLTLSAFGFTVGGEYVWGKYGQDLVGRTALANGREDAKHWVIGGTYVAGALSVGAWYGVATHDAGGASADREQTAWGIGGAYTLAPGLDLVASYISLKDENPPASVRPAGSNTRNADVVFLGARIAF